MPAIYVVFNAPITSTTSQQLMAALSQLINQQNTTSIELLLSTPGGDVSSGVTIYNFLMALPIPVNTHNIGSINSVGNIVFLAGNKRTACRHSTFTFHGVTFSAQNITFDAAAAKERLELLLADHKRIEAILQERTKISPREARQLLNKTRTKHADYALSSGIISAIEDAAIPRDAPIITILTGG